MFHIIGNIGLRGAKGERGPFGEMGPDGLPGSVGYPGDKGDSGKWFYLQSQKLKNRLKLNSMKNSNIAPQTHVFLYKIY